MTTPNEQPPGLSLGVSDILFILFRRKWMILAGLVLGVGAAIALYKIKVPLYYSTAKLLVRYVTDSKGPDASDPNEIVRSPELRGNSIVSAEVEILTSQDSLLRAAEKTGLARVLGEEGNTNRFAAAVALKSGLIVEVAKNAPVITVNLGHADPEVARVALGHLVKEYLARHVEVHRSSGTYEFLQDQTEQIRFRLRDVEDELRREKAKINVTSVPEAKSELIKWRSELSKQIADVESALAQNEARLAPFSKTATEFGTKNAATNAAPAEASEVADSDKADRYKMLAERLNSLRAREVELLSIYKESVTPVQQLRQQIASVEASLKNLNVSPASLASPPSSFGPSSAILPFDLSGEKVSAAALQARLKSMTNQLEKLDLKLKEIDAAEGPIVALERRKELTEDLYTYFQKNLDRARIDTTIDTEKLNNITVVQEPTLAAKDTEGIQKLLGIAFGGCFGGALALAFALELFLDPTFKRRKDIETQLKVPVFATIPDFGRNGHSKLKPSRGAELPALANGEIAPWDDADPMLPYYEALRDRIVMSYGNDLHKPKIVGLTSCNAGAGVSRIATGLAASLSRDVERNVLLIALERGKVAVSAFAKGRPAEFMGDGGSLEPDALAQTSQVPATGDEFVRENLSSLARTGRNLAGASIVQSFSDLMPRLKTSEYDFIIFDMPPIDQTSGALRLASQMEQTVLVVEAEKSSREQLKRARSLLAGSSASVVALLNKVRSCGPKFLDHEL